MDKESWVVFGLAAGLWFMREAIGVALGFRDRLQKRRSDPPASPAPADEGAGVSNSGQWRAIPPEELATARDVGQLRQDFQRLHDSTVRLADRLDGLTRVVGQLEGRIRPSLRSE